MDAPQEVRTLVSEGRKIAAVKKLRQLTGMGLAEAKDCVDALAADAKERGEDLSSRPPRRSSSTNYANLALAGFLLGGLFAFGSIYQIVQASRTHSWPSTSGIIVESEAYSGSRGGSKLKVRYSYAVGGTEYTGDRVGYGRVYSDVGAEETARAYPEGKEVTVHYQPSSPATSVLETGASAGIYAFLAVGLAGLAIGAWAKFKERAQRAPALKHAAAPRPAA